MKPRRTNKSNKKSILIVSILAAILIGGGTVFALSRIEGTILNPSGSQMETQTNNDSKKDFIENTNPDGSPKDSEPQNSDSVSIEVSAKKETDGSVTVFTNTKTIAKGECTLTITNNSKTVTKTAPIFYQAEYSSCSGFSIDRMESLEIGAGTWNISLVAKDGAQIHTKDISFDFEVSE